MVSCNLCGNKQDLIHIEVVEGWTGNIREDSVPYLACRFCGLTKYKYVEGDSFTELMGGRL